jgi:predicted DNA-binding transcriptional regulator YafY
MAESATTDDRVKDRLGGWQDSETRKHIYKDRETDELRTQAAGVRRQLRLGLPASTVPTSTQSPSPGSNTDALDLDAIIAALTPEQRVLLAARLDGAVAE